MREGQSLTQDTSLRFRDAPTTLIDVAYINALAGRRLAAAAAGRVDAGR